MFAAMLFELARGSNTSFHLAILYDLMTRQNWQRCIEEGDPHFNLGEAAAAVQSALHVRPRGGSLVVLHVCESFKSVATALRIFLSFSVFRN